MTKKSAKVFNLLTETQKRQSKLIDLGYSINAQPEKVKQSNHLDRILKQFEKKK